MTPTDTDIYKKQISLTEWFEKISHQASEKIRNEDNEKRERLAILNKIINLPFDKPIKLKVLDIINKTKKFKKILNEQGDELCALRLIPLQPDLPKLRMRGQTLKQVIKTWLPKQKIDYEKYRAEIIAHPKTHYWSTIFVVNQKGIFGEIVAARHHFLTQAIDHNHEIINFNYDFKKISTFPKNIQAEEYLKKIFKYIYVEKENQKKLKEELKTKFFNNYISGYFETVCSELGSWYIDYNRILGDMYSNFQIKKIKPAYLNGKTGSKGKTTGKVKIITNPKKEKIQLKEILVCEMTTPEYISLMQKAKAIITDKGGILSHAAIIARELGKPCIVDTKKASKKLHNGDIIEMNADNGTINLKK